jgi:hypothetical protein
MGDERDPEDDGQPRWRIVALVILLTAVITAYAVILIRL